MKLVMPYLAGGPYEGWTETPCFEYSSAEDLRRDLEAKIDTILMLSHEELGIYYNYDFLFCGRRFELSDFYVPTNGGLGGDRVKRIPQVYTLDEWFEENLVNRG